ncbi:MAG: T9SS type A sorting domain-containing protein [Flavobacteriales bacterium]|nr:T9SS type A sorting domain-containing protein [Flavobacteriales bacterium]MCC6938862.1 T9SS type A sorting domain-containing protein [Flavobacteriales bacterium]
MNKILLLGGLLVISASAAAQTSRNLPSARTLKADGHAGSAALVNDNLLPVQGTDRGTSFWFEDFSGGAIPAGWTNVDIGSAPTDPPVTFVWSNDPAAVGPSALNYVPSSVFNAPGAGDGYVWANSDRGLPAAPVQNHLTQLTTTAIDCSGQPTVQLSLSALIGVFDLDASDFAVVRVSTDMTNWTTYQLFPCLVTGAAAPPCSRWSANPENVIVDISATAAGQSTVYLQFQWEGLWEYFWAIDDIVLSQLPDYERRIANLYVAHVDGGYEFARIPRNQLGTSLNLGGDVINQGANDQTNVTLTATVTGPGGVNFSASQNFAVIAPGETVNMVQVATLPVGMQEGTYTVDYAVTSDQDASEYNPLNDVFTRKFQLNDLTYSMDGVGIHPAAIENLTSMGSNSFTGAADGLEIMTYYEFRNTATVYGIYVEITSTTVPGSAILASVYDTLSVLGTPADFTSPLAQSDIITVTAADVAAGRVLAPFLDPVDLTPNAYYASVRLFSSANATDIRVVDDVTVAQPNIASLIFIPGDQVYTNGNASAVRMVLDQNISVSELTPLEGVSVSPNPTNGLLTVRSINAGTHTIQVLNALGEVLMTDRFAGSTSIDLGSFAAGVYLVRVSTPNGVSVQRVTRN